MSLILFLFTAFALYLNSGRLITTKLVKVRWVVTTLALLGNLAVWFYGTPTSMWHVISLVLIIATWFLESFHLTYRQKREVEMKLDLNSGEIVEHIELLRNLQRLDDKSSGDSIKERQRIFSLYEAKLNELAEAGYVFKAQETNSRNWYFLSKKGREFLR